MSSVPSAPLSLHKVSVLVQDSTWLLSCWLSPLLSSIAVGHQLVALCEFSYPILTRRLLVTFPLVSPMVMHISQNLAYIPGFFLLDRPTKILHVGFPPQLSQKNVTNLSYNPIGKSDSYYSPNGTTLRHHRQVLPPSHRSFLSPSIDEIQNTFLP